MKAIRHLAWSLALILPLAITPQALAANVFPGVGTVDYNEGANTLSLVIPYHARNPYRVQWLNGQNRLVVDVEGMSLPGNRAMYIGMGVVTQVRAAKLRAGVTRMIFDLSQSADLRTLTDQGSRTLTLTIFPRGGAPAPRYGFVPGPRPTRRPVGPIRPGNPTVPLYGGRVTPMPVQPSFAPIAVPTPEPTPITMLPTPQPTFVPTPDATPFDPNATPTPEAPPSDQPPGEQMIFGSRFMVGGDFPISTTEKYASDPAADPPVNVGGATDFSLGFNYGANLEWSQMFGSNFGFGLNAHGIGYTISDDEATTDGVKVTHQRGDYGLGIGPRFRLGLPAGLEVFAQPNLLVRTLTVTSNSQTLDADGNAVGDAVPLTDDTYLNTGWLGYGGGLQAGLGYRVFGPFSLALTGEYNFLAGSMNNKGAATIFPLMGFGAGAEARLDFGLLGIQLGYNYSSNGNGSIGLSQSSTGPYVKVGVVY